MGDKYMEKLIGSILFIGVIYVIVLFSPQIMQEIRGPATDLTVNAQFDSDGNISEYKITFKMPDKYSYDKFLLYVNSQGYSTIREYFLREISPSQIFEYEYDPKDLTVTFWVAQPFDPNTATNTIRIIKQEDRWRYEDSSFEGEYFIPDYFINSVTYKLDCPTEIKNTNADKQGKFLWANRLTWTIDRNKDAVGSSTLKAVIPTFYANVTTPEVPEVIVVPGFGPLVTFIGILVIALLKRK